MSLEKAKAHLAKYNLADKIIILEQSSATVELAAAALGVEAARITKTLAFLIEEKAVLVLTAGDVKIDNRKYHDFFKTKAKMLPYENCEELIGHPAGGVCPFGINAGIVVYLDKSLKRFASVFPACGTGNTAIELTIPQLESCSNYQQWIDVTVEKQLL